MAILYGDYAQNVVEENQIADLDKKIAAYIDAVDEVRCFDELLEHEQDWRVFYQLSSYRGDLLEWYPFGENARVLEVDAGFGGLTGKLCEKCAHVVVTERSMFRANALKKRYESAENLEIYVGDARQLTFEEAFDYIVLVGVLEQAGDIVTYLRQIRQHLKESGKLLLAVENRFGLHFFCGGVDWHTGKAFGSINQYERTVEGDKSISRSELQDFLSKAGLENFCFYYPLPDYRFPLLVYSDDRLPHKDELTDISIYNVRQDTLVADERRLYAEVITNGAFPFMANSFLVECALPGMSLSVGMGEDITFPCVLRLDSSKLPAQWFVCCEKRMEENALRLVSEAEKIANYQVSDRMKKIWKIELEMMDEIDRICKRHQLTYFLVHGSLLGAVRHKGFIPWDDDLDIAMPRKDYQRFLEVAPKELKPCMAVCTPRGQKDIFWGGHARVCNKQTTAIEARNLNRSGDMGIWVDILPLDACTMDEKRFEKKKKKIRHCHRLINAKVYGRDYRSFGEVKCLWWLGYRLMAAFSSHERLCDRLDVAMQLYGEESTEDVAFFSGYYKHRRMNAKDFASVVLLEFAGRMVPAPVGFEKYLFMTMGKDYMEYPPEEQRKPKHTGIYDSEKPYTEYQKMLNETFKEVKGKQIIVFGAGMMFEDYMKKYGGKYRPAFIVDNDENKWGRNRMGIEIREPAAILKIPEKKRHLIICSYYYKEIQRQLETLGIRDYHVYVQHAEWIVNAENNY